MSTFLSDAVRFELKDEDEPWGELGEEVPT